MTKTYVADEVAFEDGVEAFNEYMDAAVNPYDRVEELDSWFSFEEGKLHAKRVAEGV